MSYGFRAYCRSIEVATSRYSGLAFPLIKDSGNHISYNTVPNQFSQVEFVLSPLMGFWGNSQESVAKQFNFPTQIVGRGARISQNERDVTNLMMNSGRNTQIKYRDNHIIQADHAVIGLSNTIGENSTKYNQKMGKYGIFCQDSIVNIATQVDSYKLYGTELYVGSTTSEVLAQPPSNTFDKGLSRKAVVFFVPCNASSELLAVCPENYVPDVSIALYAQTPTGCIYVMYTNDITQRLLVYRYKLGYQQPQGVGYGIRIRNNQGNVTFDTRLPPLIPLFVSTSGKLNDIGTGFFSLAVVFSRVDTLFNMGYAWGNPVSHFHESFNITNGVTWHSPYNIKRAFMGIVRGKWVDDAMLDTMFVDSIDLASPFVQRSGLTKNDYQNSGSFLGVIAYSYS